MHDGNNPQWFFVRHVGYQVLAYMDEAERPRSKVRAGVAYTGKGNQIANGVKDFDDHAVGGVGVVWSAIYPRMSSRSL